MQILVEMGNDDFFGSDLVKLGFLSAVIENQLRKAGADPEIYLTAIINDEGENKIIKFGIRPGAGWNPQIEDLPGYLYFFGSDSD